MYNATEMGVGMGRAIWRHARTQRRGWLSGRQG
ncbi:hypothetical protein L914_15407 [Phytophthora nicotianae]|uniref:Uncharacterized protein n=1 Tax=Phytophthora nicotianae TaxID=4792 RepID=W2MPE1_PHYNI|nr:hypothetical protein L914_15407 [Phytophthora nicotianae]